MSHLQSPLPVEEPAMVINISLSSQCTLHMKMNKIIMSNCLKGIVQDVEWCESEWDGLQATNIG